MMSDSEVRPSVRGILTKLWHRVEDGLDLREATPEEKQRIGHIRDGQHVMEHGDGIGQHVKAEHGRLYIVGERWARAVSWEGFTEDRGFDKEKGGPVPRTVHWGPLLGAVLDALEGKGGLTLSDDDRRCLAFIERLRVDLFLQHLDNLGVTWRDEPAEPQPAKVGEVNPSGIAGLSEPVKLTAVAGIIGKGGRSDCIAGKLRRAGYPVVKAGRNDYGEDQHVQNLYPKYRKFRAENPAP